MSTDVDFSQTPQANRRRRDKAITLARWCYSRGIGPAVADQPVEIRRAAARAAGVAPPHVDAAGHSPTWQLVADLLRARVAWDRAHQRRPPRHVECIACTVLGTRCPICAAAPAAARPAPPPVCAACGYRLDPVLLTEGRPVHPGCDLPRPTDGPALPAGDQPGMFELNAT